MMRRKSNRHRMKHCHLNANKMEQAIASITASPDSFIRLQILQADQADAAVILAACQILLNAGEAAEEDLIHSI